MTSHLPIRVLLLCALLLLGLGGCSMFGGGEKEGKLEPTVLQLTVLAGEDINPDADGRPSPVVVRIYILESVGVFEGSDFLSLYRDDTATLGKTVIERKELTLTPGQARQFLYTLPDDVVYIGVTAYYQRLEEAQWRTVLELPPHKTTKAILRLDHTGVSFTVVG